MPAANAVRSSPTMRASPSTRTSGGPPPPQPHSPSESLLVVRPARPSVTEGMMVSGTLWLPGQHLGVDDTIGTLPTQVGGSGVRRVANSGVHGPRRASGGMRRED